MGTSEFNAGGNPAMDWHPIQGGVEIFLVASCHGNRDKLRPDGPLGSYAGYMGIRCGSSEIAFDINAGLLEQRAHVKRVARKSNESMPGSSLSFK